MNNRRRQPLPAIPEPSPALTDQITATEAEYNAKIIARIHQGVEEIPLPDTFANENSREVLRALGAELCLGVHQLPVTTYLEAAKRIWQAAWEDEGVEVDEPAMDSDGASLLAGSAAAAE